MKGKAIPYHFEANVQWKAGSFATASGPGLRQVIMVSPPAAMSGNKTETGWSPEHFLIAAVAGCFINTFQTFAENEGFQFGDLVCPVKGVVQFVEGKFMFTGIHINPVLTLLRDADEVHGRQIAGKAKHYCLISNSLKCPIEMDLELKSIDVNLDTLA